jgi:hypothetical protein
MHIKHNKIFIFSLLLLASGLTFADTEVRNKQKTLTTAGWLENIILQPWNIKLRAKLDTGAQTSSLHALDIERFKQDGDYWIRFHVENPVDGHALKPIELPLIRDVKIKKHKQKATTRPVVKMTFCLNGQIFSSEFNLVDRSKFNYPVLLGRSMLQQGIIIDPATTFTLHTDKQSCKKLMRAN